MTTTVDTATATATTTLPPYTHELNWPEGMQPYKVIDEDGSQGLPYEHYAWLRENAPLVRSEAPGSDVWLLTRYEDVRTAIRSPKIFSSQVMTPPPLTFLTLHDAPNHNRLRKVVAGAFTPKSVGIMEDRIRERATQLMNGLLENGGGDLVADYSLQLSMATISGILDVPADDLDLMKLWSDEIFTYFAQLARNAPGNDTAEKNTRDFLDYLLTNLERLYESESEAVGGHIARMWKAGELSDKEASELCSFMFVAGHDTTTILMTNAFWVLSREPEVLARLREHPEDIDKFVEELARYRGAVHRTVRRVKEDTEIAGYTIPEGSIVRLLIASANHDAEKFDNPEVFDIDRDNKGHFGFGHGVHSCVGAPLARLETRITTELITTMVGDLELDEEGGVTLAHGNNISNGPTSLHMKLSAR
ncbi:cytochrome P450 [Corynebacterium guangdongense]|uniref:Cytochrome P450 n=1 Tax=Corynebacterium guangdongense TaxID=1783348 RepID=A0ABU2A0R6_9CORY|nr:cytochrome P450 [Corynebacterium guangdongense]MDR7330685.1 cytochrome P450 [Corynebacterium guangdongense]WJZ16700.1 Vitamin D(3) 25-hydroxylase [Corynebacterium guangdongense]